MPEDLKFGEVIREYRSQMGLTQEKFAAQIGVAFSTLNRWENGRTQPSPLAREKIESLIQQFRNRDCKSGLLF